jgi:hypothetical protein
MKPQGSLLCLQEPTPLYPILSQLNPIQTFTPYVCNIHFDVLSHLCLVYPLCFITTFLYVLLISPRYTTCPVYLMLLYLITPVMFGEECKL